MVRDLKAFIKKPAVVLSLCGFATVAVIAVLLGLSTVTQSSAYNPAAAAVKTPAGGFRHTLAVLAMNDSSGQAAGQSEPGSSGEVLGVSTNSTINTPGNSAQPAAASPAVSSPIYNNPQPVYTMPPSHDIEPGPLYPTDPIPCKFSKPGSNITSCNYCVDSVFGGVSCGCRGYQGAELVCLEQ